jgi:hypothetical protein
MKLDPAQMTGLALVLLSFAVCMAIVIQAVLINWAAQLAGLPNRTLGRAIATLILSAFVSVPLGVLLSFIPFIGLVFAPVVGFLATAFVMMLLYGAGFGRCLAAAVLAWILGGVILGGLLILAHVVLAGFFLLHWR